MFVTQRPIMVIFIYKTFYAWHIFLLWKYLDLALKYLGHSFPNNRLCPNNLPVIGPNCKMYLNLTKLRWIAIPLIMYALNNIYYWKVWQSIVVLSNWFCVGHWERSEAWAIRIFKNSIFFKNFKTNLKFQKEIFKFKKMLYVLTSKSTP